MKIVHVSAVSFRPLTLLQAQIPAIVKAIHRQLREKSFKTRQVIHKVLWNHSHELDCRGYIYLFRVSKWMDTSEVSEVKLPIYTVETRGRLYKKVIKVYYDFHPQFYQFFYR